MQEEKSKGKLSPVKVTISALVTLGVLAIIIYFVTWLFFMKSVTVEPGNEVVFIDQPYFFGHQGIRSETLKQGRQLIWRTTQTAEVPVVPQSLAVNFDDISSKDNILLDFSTTIQYQITDPATLLGSFGAGWFDNNVRNQYSMMVRQAVKAQEMGNLMSKPETATLVDQTVTDQLRAAITAAKLPVRILDVTLGRAKPNDNVLTQMNQTAAEQQRQKTLAAATIAEEQRALSEEARAKADNAYRNAMQMNPEQFVRLQEAKLYSDACKGAEHCIISPSGGGVVLPVTK